MTPEQKQIAIAEFEGFIEDEPWLDGRRCWIRKDKPAHIGYEESDIPPYLTSRDAICGAVARLDDVRLREYAKNLQEVCHQYCVGIIPDYQHDLRSLAKLALATPAQLADALLLTLGYEI